MIRITGGKFKGRTIKIPKNLKVRPTRSMVREAIFDMIGDRIRGAVVLDLFSGSGLLGLEAKSRGADKVFFVERDRAVCRTLKENLFSLTSLRRDPILCSTVQRALRQLAQAGVSFDIVLMDPPYQMSIDPVLKSLGATGIVTPGGWVILERGKAFPRDSVPDGLTLVKEKTYGSSKVYIFQGRRNP